MTEPIHQYARIGIVHFMAYKACLQGEGPILETLEKIALDPYFNVVEVTQMKDAQVRKDAAAEALAREGGARLRPLRLDVTEADSIATAAEQVAKETGGAGLAGLVNNAGIAVAFPMELLSLERLREQLEVNLVGTLATTQALLPLLREATGRIVNVGSAASRVTLPFLGPYSAAKAGLRATSEALRLELRPWRIRVSLIEPGAVATPIWGKARQDSDDLLAEVRPEARAPYAARVEAMQHFTQQWGSGGVPPERVVRAIRHALTARRPRARYPIGLDARLEGGLARLLPPWLADRVMLWRM